MPNRTTKVSLVAEVSNYVAGMRKAADHTKEFGTEAEKLAQQKEGLNTLGTAALAVGAVAAAGVGLAVSKFAEFDAQMSSVKAATHETASNMDLLREAAMKAGADTAFSATEAAQAEEELAKAGVSVKDILGGGLQGALDLAAAGQLDVASAAEIAATAMTQFGLSGSQVPHVADLLSAGAGKAQGSVEDLSQALNQGGLVASQTGLTIEETTGTLAAFASAGLLGSDAGTSFKTMLQRLTPQSAEAKAKMDELGISAYDAQGNFIGMSEFAGQLQTSLKDLSPEARNSALSVIFGSDAVRAASVVYEQGAEGIQSWIDKVNDAGYAADTARIKQDNLRGDLEKLGGSIDTALIQAGSGANDALRGIVQSITNLTDAFGMLPEPLQGSIVKVGIIAAGIAVLGGAALVAVPKIIQFRTALSSLGVTGGAVAKGFGKGGAILLGITALASAFGNLAAKTTLTEDQLAGLNNTLKVGGIDALNEQFRDATSSIIGTEEQLHGFRAAMDASFSGDINKNEATFYKFVDGLSLGLTHLSDRAQTNEAKFREMGEQLAAVAKTDLKSATKQFNDYVEALGGGDEAVRMALEAFPAYKAAITDVFTQAGKTATEQDILNAAIGQGSVVQAAMRDQTARATSGLADMSAGAQDATGKVNDLADSLRNFAQGQFDLNSAQRDFEQAVDDANAKLEEQREEYLKPQKDAYEEANGSLDGFVGNLDGFTASLDISTQAGRDNQAALDAIAKTTNEVAAETYEQTGSQEEATAALGRGREALIAQLAQFGITGAAADAYVAKLLATPEDLATTLRLLNAEAVQQRLAEITADRTVAVRVLVQEAMQNGNYSSTGIQPYMTTPGRAGGGEISGPGTGTSDEAGLYRLSNGEHVLTASDVQAMGGQQEVYRMRARLHRGYAGGGEVRKDYATATSLAVSAPPVTIVQDTGPNYFTGQLVTDQGHVIGVVRGELDARDRESNMTSLMGVQP